MRTERYEPVSYDDILQKIDEVVRLNKLDLIPPQVEWRDSQLDGVDKLRANKSLSAPRSWRSVRPVLIRYRISDFELRFPGKLKVILRDGDELIINYY